MSTKNTKQKWLPPGGPDTYTGDLFDAEPARDAEAPHAPLVPLEPGEPAAFEQVPEPTAAYPDGMPVLTLTAGALRQLERACVGATKALADLGLLLKADAQRL